MRTRDGVCGQHKANCTILLHASQRVFCMCFVMKTMMQVSVLVRKVHNSPLAVAPILQSSLSSLLASAFASLG